MSELEIHRHSDPSSLDRALAEEIAGVLASAITVNGCASLALSGGSTPRGLLGCLGALPLAWDQVTVTLVDERWVDAAHPDSNARMVRETLLAGAAGAAAFIPLYTAREHPSQAVEEVEAALAGLGTIDVLMLGMGGDGHFASLFPDSSALAAGLDLGGERACIAVDPPAAPHARMSMTLPRIIDTDKLILHITGADKLEVLERAAAERLPERLPIAALLGLEQPRLEIHWAP
ncbi:MAG: 6-phosphogluconolactonase [Halieaceae bacterium]|jgi:6-phosphogluconolactonase|nr:6-phosphogluconolactonase [Halieaceae bacterium]